MKTLKIYMVLLLVALFGVAALSADDGRNHSFSISPAFGFQKVIYSGDDYKDISAFGYGVAVDYRYYLGKDTYVGLGASLEEYEYENFYGYLNLKVAARFKHHFLTIEKGQATNRFNFSCGFGVDSVYKNNGQQGVYPLFTCGLGYDFIPDSSDNSPQILTGIEIQGTVQDFSCTFNLVGSVGLEYAFGGKTGGSEK